MSSRSRHEGSRTVQLDDPGVRPALYEAYRQMAKNPNSKGELHGPCPVGGGDDRFFIKPNGRFGCRICKAGKNNPDGFKKILRELAYMARLDLSAPQRTRGQPRRSSPWDQTSVLVPDPVQPRTGRNFMIRSVTGETTHIIADSPRSALEEFRKFIEDDLADDLLMVDMTEDVYNTLAHGTPAIDYCLVRKQPTYRDWYIALRAPERISYPLKDFTIDKYTIPVVRPARISQNEWGVRLTAQQVSDLRNHRIVRVRTRKGDRWYAKVDALVRETDRGAVLSVSDQKFMLFQEKCRRYRAWTRHEQRVARGKLSPELPNEHVPIQNERLREPLQRLRGQDSPSPTHEPKDRPPPPMNKVHSNGLGIKPVQAHFAAPTHPTITHSYGGETMGMGR